MLSDPTVWFSEDFRIKKDAWPDCEDNSRVRKIELKWNLFGHLPPDGSKRISPQDSNHSLLLAVQDWLVCLSVAERHPDDPQQLAVINLKNIFSHKSIN